LNVIPSTIADVLIIEPKVYGDARGFFMETWQRRSYAGAGVDIDFVQDNHSRSVRGTLRGLHYQIKQPQGKLVRVTHGEVFDVAVDLRRSSPDFGRWVGVWLSAENRRQLWVPAGFAHGFCVTSDVAEFQYKCSDYYAPEHERTLRWDDPSLGIEWPVAVHELVLSEKDRAGSFLEEVDHYP
jgi:dTDP-4-dehydrorhamnose 3,5-epimerase